MKSVTRLMINTYGLQKIDFMGYTFSNNNASFHHLIIPNRLGGLEIPENGAVLNGKTSHPYLHIIESKDYEIFSLISSEMIDENIKGHLDIENLKNIRDLLEYFEKEHMNDTTKKGKRLVKREFITGRVDLSKL